MRKTSAIIATAIVFVAAIAGVLMMPSEDVYDFQLHQKISATSDMRLSFPVRMDQHSVDEHLLLPSDLQATTKWEEETLVIKPSADLLLDHSYKIRIDAGALQADGLPLGKELIFVFTVAGAPVVAATIPTASASNVATNAEITVVFDRPMQALSQVQRTRNAFAGWPVSMKPSLRGSWKWLGTTTATFVPEKALQKATEYSVSVPAGIPTLGGEKTVQDFSWKFSTERPQFLSSSPERGSTSSGPSTRLLLRFNQEMDLLSARDSITLEKLSGSKGSETPSISIIPMQKIVYETEKVQETTVTDKKSIVLIPSLPLEFSSRYVIRLKKAQKGLEGDLGTEIDETVEFSTVGDFAIKNVSYDPKTKALRIDVTNPVDVDVLVSSLAWDPPLKLDSSSISAYELEEEKVFRIEMYPPLLPSTKYQISLDQKMVDVYSQKLQKPWSFSFETPAMDPSVFVHPRQNEFGIFEKSKSPILFINHLNVSSLDVSLGPVSFSRFLEMRKKRLETYEEYSDIREYATSLEKYNVKTTSAKNTWSIEEFDLTRKMNPDTRGLYAMTVQSPEWKNEKGSPLQDFRLFSVTDLAITLKYSGLKTLVWVTNVQTGEPVKNARISYYSLQGAVPLSGTTNAEGLFEANLDIKAFQNREYDYQPEFWVTAETQDDFAFTGSDWNNSFQPHQFDGSIYTEFRSPNAPAFRTPYYLYTERPLYGAGDTVNFKGVIRLLDWNGNLSLPSTQSRTVFVRVNDAEGKEVYTKTLKLSPFGTFTDNIQLAKDSTLGMYSIQAKLLPDSDIDREMWSSFNVLAYRKPEYKLSLSTDKEEYKSDEVATLTLAGNYYFGAPMASAKVRYRASTMDYFFNKYSDEWYSFGEIGSWCWYRCERGEAEFTTGEGVLDAAGRLVIKVPTKLEGKKMSQVMSVEADVTDQNNQVVSGRADFVVHASDTYVGIRTDEYAVAEGKDAAIKIITLKPDGSPQKNISVTLSLYSRTWNTTKQKGVDGEFYYDNVPEDALLQTKKLTTGDSGKGTGSFTLSKGGEYVVVATVQDSKGRESRASWTLYAWSGTYFSWPRSNSDRMEVVLDKPTYSVGDTARLLVKSPYQGKGVKALVTVERENVLTKKIIEVTSNAQAIEIPVTDDLLPVAYVSVIVMKPRIGETFDDKGIDTGSPSFKVGYAKILVDTKPRKLNVVIRTEKEKYLPGESVKVAIEATTSDGKPVQAEFSLGVVDLSLIDLTGFSMPDLVSAFYYERGLGVITSHMMTYLLERFKPGSKGGGGGDDQDGKRGTFLDTAYWNPSVVTDANGRATVSFKLPDNLTTWQLLALGSTKDHRFGGEAKTILETKNVIVRPVRPRFAIDGDMATLGAIIHNYLDEDHTFTVTVSGVGFAHRGKEIQEVFVPKDGSVIVNFPVTFGTLPQATLRFTAASGDAKDDIEEVIPVYRFGVMQSVATSGVTQDQVTETIIVPKKSDVPSGDLTVNIAPSLGVYLGSGLEYLSQFPYGCAEQTLSALVPSIALKQLQGFDQFNYVSSSELQRNITTGLQQVYSFQRGDGGFGYFQGSLASYPYLTAYILYGFSIAKDAGYPVDQGVSSAALQYLRNSVRSSERTVDSVSRAYIAYVLSLYGSSNVAELSALYELRSELPLHARAHIAMALKNAKIEAKAQTLLKEILTTIRIDARGAHFEESGKGWNDSMNTDERTTAVVLQSILAIDPSNPLTTKIITGMLSSRQNGHWDTTQSTAQALLAFVQYLKISQELDYNFKANVELAGTSLLQHSFENTTLEKKEVTKSIDEMVRGSTASLKIGKTGKGNLYYDAVLSYFYSPDILEPAEEGIGIVRETTPLTKSDAGNKVGSIQKVRLTITVPETRHFVAVESMLAAGYEPIDLGYATSQKNLLGQTTNADTGNWLDYYRNQVWRFSHIELRDDRIFLFAEELPAGVYRYEYLVRATTPGTYRERPAKVWEMYYPETFGQTSGGWITVSPQ